MNDRVRPDTIRLKSIFFAIMMLVSLPPAFAAPPRMDTLAISRSEDGMTLGCASDKLCVAITSSKVGCEGKTCAAAVVDSTDLSLKLFGGQRDLARTPYSLTGQSSADDGSSLQLWPHIIRFEGGVLAGVKALASTGYAGGGATSATLHLIAFLPRQPPFEVLSVPWNYSATIQACFSKRDVRQRAGSCEDDYSLYADLIPIKTSATGMPALRYRSKATSFPGRVSRSKDSLARRPLRKSDLVTVTDPQCSYQRLYRFDPGARTYVPNTPLPDCSNYTIP